MESVGYILVFVLSAAIAALELASRGREAPLRLLMTTPSLIYAVLNGSIACLVLMFLNTSTLPVVVTTEFYRLLFLVGMAVLLSNLAFRASILSIRVNHADLDVGPNALRQILLEAVDRAFDRMRAGTRAASITALMDGISFDKARTVLVPFCLATSILPPEEQESVSRQVEALARTNLSDSLKVLNLGLVLRDAVGEDILRQATRRLDIADYAPRMLRTAAPSVVKQSLLQMLLSSGTVSPGELLTRVNIDPGAVLQELDDLESQGFIEVTGPRSLDDIATVVRTATEETRNRPVTPAGESRDEVIEALSVTDNRFEETGLRLSPAGLRLALES